MKRMKIAIIGVGAIGGFVGAQLAHAGEDVTFIARGATLEALKERGIRLTMGDGSEKIGSAASMRPRTTPRPDRKTS